MSAASKSSARFPIVSRFLAEPLLAGIFSLPFFIGSGDKGDDGMIGMLPGVTY
jgi:hypothetical protein